MSRLPEGLGWVHETDSTGLAEMLRDVLNWEKWMDAWPVRVSMFVSYRVLRWDLKVGTSVCLAVRFVFQDVWTVTDLSVQWPDFMRWFSWSCVFWHSTRCTFHSSDYHHHHHHLVPPIKPLACIVITGLGFYLQLVVLWKSLKEFLGAWLNGDYQCRERGVERGLPIL